MSMVYCVICRVSGCIYQIQISNKVGSKPVVGIHAMPEQFDVYGIKVLDILELFDLGASRAANTDKLYSWKISGYGG